MMGPTKLSTIRAELRKSLDMSDAELRKWFDRHLGGLARRPKSNTTELDTLTLLRDALLRETKPGTRRNTSKRAGARGRK
jgi:hypothetical protein